MEENIIQVLCNILEIDGVTAKETVTHILLTLGVLNDANVTFLDERLTKIIVNILSNSTSLEISEMCLELLYDQADDGKIIYCITKQIYI